jgi:hypothetical protein
MESLSQFGKKCSLDPELEWKCGNELVPSVHHHPKPVRWSAINGDADLVTEIILKNLAGSPIGIVANPSIGDGFGHQLPEGIFSNPWRKLPCALSGAIRPMSFLDVTNRLLRDDHSARRTVGWTGLILRTRMANSGPDQANDYPGEPSGRPPPLAKS